MSVAVPAFVYRAYDANDELIYVGSTKNVAARVGQHEAASAWWTDEVTRMAVDIHPDRERAAGAERALIDRYNPRHNIVHAAPKRRVSTRERYERQRKSGAHIAEVTREDGWWMIRVPEFDLITQARSWSRVELMAQGVIAAHLDLDPESVGVEPVGRPDAETERLLEEARTKAADADLLRAEALAANQQAARRLHGDGWSYRLIARAMHLTHQRVEQLVKGTR